MNTEVILPTGVAPSTMVRFGSATIVVLKELNILLSFSLARISSCKLLSSPGIWPRTPLTDSKIAEVLGEQGILVARRTVAKYREALAIPPVNLRKSL